MRYLLALVLSLCVASVGFGQVPTRAKKDGKVPAVKKDVKKDVVKKDVKKEGKAVHKGKHRHHGMWGKCHKHRHHGMWGKARHHRHGTAVKGKCPRFMGKYPCPKLEGKKAPKSKLKVPPKGPRPMPEGRGPRGPRGPRPLV